MKKICRKGHYYDGRRCPQCNNTRDRGYDHRWRLLSEFKRQKSPLCERCDREGRTTSAECVHHKIPINSAPHLRLEMSNLESLCNDCHQKTHEEMREF
jgi:5-methylcytosine-specific restriction protein A